MNSHNAEELAQALFEEAGDALFIFDPETEDIQDVNPTAQRLSGFARAELLRLKASYLFRSEAQGGLNRLRQAYRKTGVFHSQEGFYLRTQQEGVWIPINVTITRLHVKPRTLGLITARDVREQREAHAQLKKMEAELRRVMASISDCLWSAEIDGTGQWTYRYLSPVVTRITGQRPDFFLSSVSQWRGIVHPDDRETWDQAVARLTAGKPSQEEYRIVWPDGTTRWVSDRVMVSQNKHGERASRVLKLDGVLTDITERKCAEVALRTSEERLTRVVETIADGIIIVGLDRRIIFANAAAETILGLPRSEITRRTYDDPSWKMTTVSGKRLSDETSAFVRVLRTGEPVYDVEQAIRRPDRSWGIVSINAAPMRDDSGALVGIIASLNDITERKRAELAVQRRGDEQEAVARVSRLLLQIDSSRGLFAEVPEVLSQLFDFEIVAIEMVDQRTDELVFLGSTGISWHGTAPLRVPVAETLSGTVLEKGEAVVVTEAQANLPWLSMDLKQLRVATIACLPLITSKGAIGTLVLATRQQKPVPPSLPITLQTIADLLAHTIERKRAEDALRSTNETMRALIQASPLAIYAVDTSRQLRSWNAAAERMYGWKAGEVLGQPLPTVSPDKVEEAASLQTRVLQGESFTGVETRRQKKDGTQIDVSLSAAPLYDTQGRVSGIIAVAADITERKRAEEALREREWRLQAIVNSEPECLKIVSVDGMLLEMNPAGLAMLEAADAGELIGKPVVNLVHPEDRTAYQQLHSSVCRGKAGTLRFRAIGVRGGLRWMEMHAAPLRGHQGDIVSVLSVSRDITERVRADEALRRSEERFRALVENGSDAIALINARATILYASPSTTRILGYSVEEFLGRNTFDFMHPDDLRRTAEQFSDCVANPGKDILTEYRYRHKNGSWRFIEAVAQNRLADLSVQAIVVNYRDISERKRAETELSYERDLLQTLMQNIPDLIYFKDASSRFTRINVAQTRYLGLDHPQEALGKSDFNFFPEAIAHEFYNDEQRIVRTGRPLINKMERHTGPDGSERWILSTKVPIFNAGGRVTGIVGLGRDITDRKRSEEALRNSEKRYRLLFERNLAGVFRCQLDGRILDCNDSFARILGHGSREEVLAQLTSDYYYNDEDRTAFMSLVQERHALMNFENCLRRKDGSPVWVLENVSFLQGEDGQDVLEGTVFDITERKRAEEALAQERALLRSLIDSIPDLIFYKNREGVYLGCNTAFEEYTGQKERVLIDRTDLDLFPHELGQAYRATDVHVLADGQPRRNEEWLAYPNGRRVLVETLRTPFFGPDGRTLGLIGISRDITERKHLEGQLRQAQKMEAVGQLAGGVAHDFNNLLTAILGNVSLIMTAVPPHDPNYELLTATEKAGLRAADLTRQLLGFSRQTMLRLEPVNLGASVEETIGIVGRTLDPRIQVEVNLAPDLWTVQADPGQISQILLNLCLNARDAMPTGGQLLLETANIVLGADDVHLLLEAHPGEFVRLRVRDTGHGIPPEIRSRIFDPFFTTKGPGKGTGLGLAMVFGIVKQHQGWIDCSSEIDQGTCFDIFLPRSQETAAPAPEPPPPTAPAGSETILLADDEAIIRNLGRTILQRHGYHVLLAEDGQQAIDIYQREKMRIDLVILDLTMPTMSGRDAFRQLVQMDPDVRVMFASGYSADHLSESERDGVLGFITKPYRPQDLASKVRMVLDRVQAGNGR